MVVHFVVIGTPWMLYRVYASRKLEMDAKPWKVTFTWLIILAVITGVAYFTGPETADWTKQVIEPFPQEHVENHALWGRVALVIQGIVGLLGIMCWSSLLQEQKPDRRIYWVLFVLLLINTLIIAYTAHLGGLIRRMDLM